MKSSGWVNTDAMNWVECPKCKQSTGKPCRHPSGKIYYDTHWQRIVALQRHPEFNDKNYRRGDSK